MKAYKTAILGFGAFLIACEPALSEVAPLSIRESTKACEKEVVDACIQTDCPTYCDATERGERIDNCKKDCSKKCVIKPMSDKSKDKSTDTALDAQVREHTFACIAEKRDPEGTKSGRRMEKWQEIDTPSFAKLKNSK